MKLQSTLKQESWDLASIVFSLLSSMNKYKLSFTFYYINTRAMLAPVVIPALYFQETQLMNELCCQGFTNHFLL